MIIPPFLKPGDKVGIVAPARKISELEMQKPMELIRQWGLEPVPGLSLHKELNQFSGTDEERAGDLNSFLKDKSIKAIICARGGYGALRIVDQIDWDILKSQPKWIVGYSDITVFHSHLNHDLQLATLHGTMPINFSKNTEATESLRKRLFGEQLNVGSNPNPFNRHGSSNGKLIGGNLSILYSLVGSKSFSVSDDAILFIEDLDEYLYHIDRMMISLKRAGILKSLRGLIVGGMTEMKDNQVPFGKTAEEIISDAVNDYDYPVCFDFPAGHVDKNLAIYFGMEASLEVSGEGGILRYI